MNAMRISLATFCCLAAWMQALLAVQAAAAEKPAPMVKIDNTKFNDWLARWQKNIVGDARNRYCDKDMGEDIAWRITPFTDGFYYGYVATHDPKWARYAHRLDRLLGQAGGEGAGRLSGLAQPRRGRNQGRQPRRLHRRQHAGRDDGHPRSRAPGRRNPQDAQHEGQVRRQGGKLHPALRADL